jgi:hypothetical protein
MQMRFPIAVGAGLVSGLLFIAAVTGGMAGVLALVLLTPLPIAISGFAWGWIVAAIATASSFGFLTLVGSINAGLFHLLLFGLPTCAAIYFLLLNREYTKESGRTAVEWYPIGHVLFGLAITSGVVATVSLLIIGSSTADLESHVRNVVNKMMTADIPWPGGQKPTVEQFSDLVKLLTASFPAAIATSWLWIVAFNLWIGAKIARTSGLLSRPWPNVSLVALPRLAGAALAATVALSFLDEYPGHIATGFGAGIFIAFMLVGLAIIHNVTWKNPCRPVLLIALYAFLVFLNPLSGLAIATIALIEPFLPMRNPYHGGLITTDPPDHDP